MKYKGTKVKVIISGIILILIISGIIHLPCIVGRTNRKDEKSEMKDDPRTVQAEASRKHVGNSEEKEIYNDNGIIVTYTGIDKENIFLTVTNNCGKDIVFENNQIAINGIMIDSSVSQEIKNKETKELNISRVSDTSKIELSEVKNIMIHLVCTDNNLDISEMVTINLGNKSYKENMKISKKEIFHEKGVRAYYKKLKEGEGL